MGGAGGAMQHCAMPVPQRTARTAPWLCALGLSLAGHAALVTRAPAPEPPAARAQPAGLQTRRLVLPLAAPEPAPRPAARPRPRAIPASPRATPLAPAPRPAAPAPLVLPTAGDWTYRLHQRGEDGIARLQWRPDGARYELRLDRDLAGRALPGWLSRGAIDADGLAPLRFTHQREGRDAQAANFRREEGLISFSASTALIPLPAGVQDRLSWWLQIPARIAAAPQRYPPGSRLSLPVAGLRGELQAWHFEIVGEDAGLLQLRREALGPYDGQLELWLDPQQGHAPVRLRLLGAAGETLWEMEALR